ncbi:MAG: MBL fold metallo-hydrolase [Minisyncoccota bacterium]
MIVSYQGLQSFKISQGDLSISINPKSKISADITLFSTGLGETADKSGFVITGPGEYEVKGISVKGFQTKGESKKLNTVYIVNFDGMNLCFLGDLGEAELGTDTLEQLGEADILFAPVTAQKIAVSLEPSIIIPTNYTGDSLKKFLKDAGEDKVSPLDKLVVKKKDLEGKEGEIVVLKEE